MDKQLLIPVSKHDFETIERIKNADPNNVQEVLPQILEWIEDINWPIALELVKVLAGFDNMITPYIVDFIRNPDGLREYSIYYFMLPLLNKVQLDLLKEELEKVAYSPSPFEIEEGYDKIALQYLQNML